MRNRIRHGVVWLVLSSGPAFAQTVPDRPTPLVTDEERAEYLLNLARKRFPGDLSDADEVLLRKTAAGKIAYYGAEVPPKDGTRVRSLQEQCVYVCSLYPNTFGHGTEIE